MTTKEKIDELLFGSIKQAPAKVNLNMFPHPNVSVNDIPGNWLQKRLRLAKHRRYEKYVAKSVKNWMKYRVKREMLDEAGGPIEFDHMSKDAKRVVTHVSRLLDRYNLYMQEAEKLVGKPEENQQKQNWRTMNMHNKSSREILAYSIQRWFIRNIKPARKSDTYPILGYEEDGPVQTSEQIIQKLEQEKSWKRPKPDIRRTSGYFDVDSVVEEGIKEKIEEKVEKEEWKSPLEIFLDTGLQEIEFSKKYDPNDIVKVQTALGVSLDEKPLLKDMLPKRLKSEERNLRTRAIDLEASIFRKLLRDLKDAKSGAKYAPKPSTLKANLERFEMYCSHRRQYLEKLKKPKERVHYLKVLVGFQEEMYKKIDPSMHFKKLRETANLNIAQNQKADLVHDEFLLSGFRPTGLNWVNEVIREYGDVLDFHPRAIEECRETIEKAYNEAVGEKVTEAPVKDVIRAYKKVRGDKVDRLYDREVEIYKEVNSRLDEWVKLRNEKFDINSIEGVEALDSDMRSKYDELKEILVLLERYERSKYQVQFPSTFKMSGVTALVNLRAAQKALGRFIDVSKRKRAFTERAARKFTGGVRKATERTRQRLDTFLHKPKDYTDILKGDEELLEGEKGLLTSLGQAIVHEVEDNDDYTIDDSVIFEIPVFGHILGEVEFTEVEKIQTDGVEIFIEVPDEDPTKLLNKMFNRGKEFHLFSHAHYMKATKYQPACFSLSSNYGSVVVSVQDDGTLLFQPETMHEDIYSAIPSFLKSVCKDEGWDLTDVNISIPLEGIPDESKVVDQAWGFMRGFSDKDIYVQDFDFSRFEEKSEHDDVVDKNDANRPAGLSLDEKF